MKKKEDICSIIEQTLLKKIQVNFRSPYPLIRKSKILESFEELLLRNKQKKDDCSDFRPLPFKFGSIFA